MYGSLISRWLFGPFLLFGVIAAFFSFSYSCFQMAFVPTPGLCRLGVESLLALGYDPVQTAGPGVGVPDHESTSLRVPASVT